MYLGNPTSTTTTSILNQVTKLTEEAEKRWRVVYLGYTLSLYHVVDESESDRPYFGANLLGAGANGDLPSEGEIFLPIVMSSQHAELFLDRGADSDGEINLLT